MQSPTGGGPGPGASRACGVCGEEAAPHGWLHCCQGVGAPQQPLEAAGVAGEPPNPPLVLADAALARKGKRVVTKTRVAKRMRIITMLKVEDGDLANSAAWH